MKEREKYNENAKKTKEYGFCINYLYAVAKNVYQSYYSDMTHLYTPEDTQLHTNTDLNAIGKALETEYAEFTVLDYESIKEMQ